MTTLATAELCRGSEEAAAMLQHLDYADQANLLPPGDGTETLETAYKMGKNHTGKPWGNEKIMGTCKKGRFMKKPTKSLLSRFPSHGQMPKITDSAPTGFV